ncbi:MAG: hypothetical protein ACI865_000435 [Flavobacteriaceae bacterium]
MSPAIRPTPPKLLPETYRIRRHTKSLPANAANETVDSCYASKSSVVAGITLFTQIPDEPCVASS